MNAFTPKPKAAPLPIATPVDWTLGDYTFKPFDLPRWEPRKALVENILDEGTLSFLVGPYGSYKSFLALDLAFSVGNGLPFLGNATSQGGVIYVAAEAPGSIIKRGLGWQHHYDRHADVVRIVDRAPRLNDPAAVQAFTRSILALRTTMTPRPKLAIFDHLSACIPGSDENSSQDMSSIADGLVTFVRETGVAALVLGHTGKDPRKGLRGWSGMEAHADTLISTSKNGTLKVYKQKDDETGHEERFRLTEVEFPDQHGILQWTMTVQQASTPRPAAWIGAMELMVELGQGNAVDQRTFFREYIARSKAAGAMVKENSLKTRADRDLKKLIAEGLVSTADGYFLIHQT